MADDSILYEKGYITYYNRAILEIEKMIRERFADKIGKDKDDLNAVLENIKFTVDDLLEAYEPFEIIFPKKYEIMEILKKNYKANIEQMIMPLMMDEEKLSSSPGLWIYLISWIEGYEDLCIKVGLDGFEFPELKNVIFFKLINKACRIIHAQIHGTH